jgi:hypothetical protein
MQQVEIVNPTGTPRAGPAQPIQDFIRRWLTGRRGLIIGGVVIVVAGMALGWNWLSAIGVAPIILSLAPCAAMCAIGACAMMKANSSGATLNSLKQAILPESVSAPAQSGGQEP